MKTIKVKCPAKINLNLQVLNKREDGFHNIESVMQTISLYDYLTISMIESERTEIRLSGTSGEIPYDKTNLVHKAGMLFLQENSITNYVVNVHIEKNIPVSAGLAGGSTDGAGMLYGLNMLFNGLMTEEELLELCSRLGSDLNFCLKGGCMMTMGRGEILSKRMYRHYPVNLIKPLDLGISAKEAYTKFSKKIEKQDSLETRKDYANDLEWAIIEDYSQLKQIKSRYPNSMMTGSGSTYFSLDKPFEQEDGFWVKNGLETIDKGVELY